MLRIAARSLALATLLAAALAAPPARATDSAQPGATLLLGRPAGFGALPDDSVNYAASGQEALSADGRYAVFVSAADGLSNEDDDTVVNIYVRDLQTNTTTLVSRASGVAGAPFDGNSYTPVISADGTKVAFESYATTLGASNLQVYVRDLVAHTTSLVSCANATNCTATTGQAPSINGDGTKIAFVSRGTNVVSPDTNGSTADVFVRDTVTHSTVLVSRSTGGTQTNQSADHPSISDDGNKVAFDTLAAYDPSDTNARTDVYMRNISGATTKWVSHSATVGVSSNPSMAGSGNSVAFQTQVPFDAAHDLNGAVDVYLWGEAGDAFLLMSRITGGANTNAGNAGSYEAAVNSNGTGVAFTTSATNLGDGDTTTVSDVHFRSGTTTSVISRAAGAGALGDGGSSGASVDDTGATVAFTSQAASLVPSVGAGSTRLYVRAVGPQTTTVASLPTGPASAGFPQLVGDDNLLGTNSFVGTSGGNSVSADGRYVAFVSSSDSLSPADDDRFSNVYVRDVLTGAVTLVNVSTGGQPADGSSFEASISADGTHVAFDSAATNLGAPGGSAQGVYVRDLVAGTTTFVSRADGAGGAPATYASGTAISADGNRVVFLTSSPLDAKDGNGASDAYVRDVAAGSTILASRIDGAGTAAGAGNTYVATISGNGRRVGFTTDSNDLGDGDADSFVNVHVRDLAADTTTLVDRADGAAGVKANNSALGVSLDDTGRRVAFVSSASNLDPGVPLSTPEVYVRDVQDGTTVLVSREGAAGPAADQGAYAGRISADGTHVAFEAYATNLLPPDTTLLQSVFVRDLAARTTTLAGRADGASGAAATATSPAINGDGSCVAFTSAGPLVPGGYGSRDFRHVYLRVVGRECPLITPDTKIDSGPSGTTVATATATFTFSADEAGATFACSVDGAAFATCTAPFTTPALANGAHTFAVRATDRAQLTDASPASAQFTTAVPPGGGKDTTPPVVGGLRLSPVRFRVGAAATAVSAAAAKRAPRGTTITYSLSEKAAATLAFDRPASGRRRGKRCVAASKAPKGAKRCTRHVPVGTLRRAAASGRRHVPFSGRIGTRALTPGHYRLTVTARDSAGNHSGPRRVAFLILRS